MATLPRTLLVQLLVVVTCAVLAACGSDPESASPAQTDAAVSAPAPPPPPPTPEELLRGEVKTWVGTPYADNGTTRQGVGNAAFVRAVLQAALGTAVGDPLEDDAERGELLVAAGELGRALARTGGVRVANRIHDVTVCRYLACFLDWRAQLMTPRRDFVTPRR